VRALKARKAAGEGVAQEVIDSEVQVLLQLKRQNYRMPGAGRAQ